jgi:hypothetical protein
VERDKSNLPRYHCPPSGDEWAYQLIHGKPKRQPQGVLVPSFKVVYDKYTELRSTDWAAAISGMGLFGWLLHNTWVSRKEPDASWKNTKYGAIQTLLDAPETIKKQRLRELSMNIFNGEGALVRSWVQLHMPRELNWFGIAKAIFNPSPMPFPKGGYRLPSFEAVTRLLFVCTAPQEELYRALKMVFHEQAEARANAELLTAMRSQLYRNALWGTVAGVSAGTLLPIHPLVAKFNVGHTVLTCLALLQNYSAQFNPPVGKQLLHQHLVGVNKQTVTRLAWRTFPGFLLGGLFASSYYLSQTYYEEPDGTKDRSKY